MSTSTDNLNRPAVKVFVATTVMLVLHLLLAGGSHRSLRPRLLCVLRGRRCREGHRQERSLVRARGHAFQLRRACHLHREQRHVRAWRRLQGRQKRDGRTARQALGLCAAVRLRAHRSDQRCFGRPVCCRLLDGHQRAFRPSADFSDNEINYLSAGFAILVSGYFWWKNIQGMHESSEKALRIMQITTVMVVMLILWCVITLIARPSAAHLPPLPQPRTCNKVTNLWAGCTAHSSRISR